MKRNLLSPAIIVPIRALGLTVCDEKKAETKPPPPANSHPAAPAPEAPVGKAEAKPETPAQPVVDEQAGATVYTHPQDRKNEVKGNLRYILNCRTYSFREFYYFIYK